MTRQITIDQLAEGDVVLAVNGKARPFPFTVTKVITHDLTVKGKRYLTTQVQFAHGGLILPTDPRHVVATVQA